ncbi:MAG: class I SAM-dependent methyltransferase [Candidatus Beckwithbacteria bacterium]|nr:class I SAM-dependent methyltransferase [Candidatus Beckwithbacteria bacterium]
MTYQREIIDYYNSSQWLYRVFCRNQFHHGFWNQNTHSLYQAALNENQAIIDLAKIKKGERVLDAGCGVGSTAIYIAEKTGAWVTGISITPIQIKFAKKHPRTNFQVQDYTHTNFPDNYFDVVYGIESICYATPKSSFLKEAYRILKPGGRLLIADGYLTKHPNTQKQKQLVEDWQKSFSLKKLDTTKEMSQQIGLAGFKKIRVTTKLNAVKPTVEHFYQLGKRLKLIIQLLGLLPFPFFLAIKRNYLAFVKEKESFETGLANYNLHQAEK